VPPDDDMHPSHDNVPVGEQDGQLMSDCKDHGRTITKAQFRNPAGPAGLMSHGGLSHPVTTLGKAQKLITPPRTASSVKKHLYKIEGLSGATSTRLFESLSSQTPVEETSRLSLRGQLVQAYLRTTLSS